MAGLPSSGICPKTIKMKFIWQFHVISVMLISIHLLGTTSDDPTVTYDVLYNAGVEAYSQERWFECLTYMHRALEDYKTYQENLIGCRRRCRSATDSPLDVKATSIELAFFEKSLKASDCLRRCKQDRFPNRPESVSQEIKETFEALQPYDYIQFCSYKSGKHKDAAAAAYTFITVHPEHESMRKNVAYYQTLLDVKPGDFRDLEIRPHQDHYVKGVNSYENEDWGGTIRHMEDALADFYQEAERCAALCEGPYDHESLPDLFNAIADHWISVLYCRWKCPTKMATISGTLVDNFLPEHFNYLQYAYYQVDKLKKASECVESYLLLQPEDQVMLENKNFYLPLDGVSAEDFKPRADLLQYNERQKTDLRMLEFVQTRYKFSDADEDSGDEQRGGGAAAERGTATGAGVMETVLNSGGAPVTAHEYGHPTSNKTIYGNRDDKFARELQSYLDDRGMNIAAEGKEGLKGSQRVAADGVLTQDECSELIQLADVGAVQGDGYKGTEAQTSPHTNYEKFAGLTVNKAAEMAVDGTVSEALAQLYLKASEAGRAFLQKYFNLQVPLYFHFTHLVCRTAIHENMQTEREDLSHPVHADNCHIQPDGSCLKQRPAYVWRDFTALLYLNDDFEGGNFFFAHKNQSVQHDLRPKCGRIVGFESSDYHGVQAVTKGKRCAVAMWYTLDPHYQETTHAAAQTTLSAIHSNSNKLDTNKKLKDLVEEKKYRLALTERELNGPDRFAMDDVASPEMCQTLIKLANEGGITGDGYKVVEGRESPHTGNERYKGLGLTRVAEDAGITGDGYKIAKGRSSPHTENEKFKGVTLTRASEDGGIKGDGYKGSQSPHTQNEMFEGLTILRAAQLAAAREVDADTVKTYLDLSDVALDIVQTYFQLSNPLHFDFTHLVCRTALDGSKTDRTDLSHPIHSDNCILQPDNTCKREPPAYVHRDYSAILYLNEDFVGGDIFFTHQNMSIQSSLRPKCGRIVGFNASNYHGVKPVLKGQRCALALWFTLDSRYKEAAHGIARNILKDLQATPLKPMGPDRTEL